MLDSRQGKKLMFDYLGNFPIPADLLPQRLRSLLEPIGIDPLERVEVSSFAETEGAGWNRETIHMVMAVVPDDGNATPVLHSDNVVAHGLPIVGEKGSERDFAPSVSGHDYIVASWGSSLFFTYNLAEKVWMALGLTPRCIGNEHQRLVYDDLSLPEFGVAEGEVSLQYHFNPSRDIKWLMSNEYLRKYLWLRGGRGVRQFFYQVTLKDSLPLRKLMNGLKFYSLGAPGSWLEGDLRETEDGLLLQVWATVDAVSCELCPQQTADGLSWPGVVGEVTRASANDILRNDVTIYLDDKFLERYEQNSLYESTPIDMHGDWSCSPSYLGQWSFTGCRRVGRNLIEVELRDLYKGVPVRETLHAHSHALDLGVVKQLDMNEEHIVSKVHRFLAQMLSLEENLSQLGVALGIEKPTVKLLGFSRSAVAGDGWLNYPQVTKLAQVASLDMTQQSFLARCKSIHEIWQKLPDGFLKQILEAMGVPRKSIASLGTLKLLQCLLNVLEKFDENCETTDALKSKNEPDDWNAKNDDVAMLFVNYDLRIADAHDSVSKIVERLQDQGFDTATLHQGHGRALDFVLDGVINSFAAINRPLSRILARA
jgi:hypothetical protein